MILVGVQKRFISRDISLDPKLTGTYYNCLLWMRRKERKKTKTTTTAKCNTQSSLKASCLLLICDCVNVMWWAVISLKKKQLAVCRCWLIIRPNLMKSWSLNCEHKSSCEESQRVIRYLLMSSYTTYYGLHHVLLRINIILKKVHNTITN